MKYSFVLICLLFTGNIWSQVKSKHGIICSYDCNITPEFLEAQCVPSDGLLARRTPIKGFNPYSEFDTIIANLGKDKSNPFQLNYLFRECSSVCNAASVTSDSVQYIFYNKDFLDGLNTADSKLLWAIRAIIAHEIGHHILHHTDLSFQDAKPALRRKMELRADYFSGYVIRRFAGATLEDANEGLNSLNQDKYIPHNAQEEMYSYYPTLDKRREAVREGFEFNGTDLNLDGYTEGIEIFKSIDSLALENYKRYGKSIILRTVDKDISLNDPKNAKLKLDELYQKSSDEEQKELIVQAQNYINEYLKKEEDTKIITDDGAISPEKQNELAKLKDEYDKLINGSLEDKKKAEELLKKIRSMENDN